MGGLDCVGEVWVGWGGSGLDGLRGVGWGGLMLCVGWFVCSFVRLTMNVCLEQKACLLQ